MKRPVLSKSSLMAAGLAAAIVIWMLTGLGDGGGSPGGTREAIAANAEASAAAPSAARPEAKSGGDKDRAPAAALAVTVTPSKAERIAREIVISGRTEPNRAVAIKAETEGRIVTLGAERGARVSAGARIALIDERERRAAVTEAERLVEHRRLQHEAAMRLEGRQLVAEVQIAETAALLASAEAQLQRVRLDLDRTTVSAPFDGVLEERNVELGDYVGIGDTIAQLVDNDPLIAVGEVSEREIDGVAVGTRGRARLISGEILEGTVRYVSPVADPSTRTFRIELALPNPQNKLPAGMTAELRLPTGEVDAHFLSPALLALDDAGLIGVKTVDERNKVRFHEVEIVRSANDGVWVTGLPEDARVITIGQGFVAVGETVRPVPADR